jgi:hypothetical protein
VDGASVAMTAICKSLSPRCSSLQLLTGDLNWLSIHGPHLEWTPAPERSSGRSTPNSMTLIVHKSVAPGKTFAESEKDMSHPVNCKNTHCWGYIQGLCPFTVPAADLFSAASAVLSRTREGHLIILHDQAYASAVRHH